MSAFSDDPSRSFAPAESPVTAAFAPKASAASSFPRQRQTIIVHQKSPLLLATPPQVTRALAFSYPFLNPLSRLAGLVSWSTGDPWESFLLLSAFWFITLYGDLVIQWAGPLLFVAFLMAGMYARRFSSLSSNRRPSSKRPSASSTTPDKDKGKKKAPAATRHDPSRHPKSLDEIVASLQLFTSRCNILLDPFLQMTDFLSTQVTATSATTRPALIALFTRLLILSPVWSLLTLWPFYIITTRRVVFTVGTLILSWHSQPARVSRVILWRSRSLRKLFEIVTGLSLSAPAFKDSSAPRGIHTVKEIEKSIADAKREKKAKTGSATISSEGICFTFSLYENQRRWIGIGWTSSMLAYERAAWTDDQLNPTPSKDDFRLPVIQGGAAKWRWIEGSDWEVDLDDATQHEADSLDKNPSETPGASRSAGGSNAGTTEEASWTYYDNKWMNGRRGTDGWGRYTRRRKWMRDAELVEAAPGDETTPTASPSLRPSSAGTTDVPATDLLHASPFTPTSAPKPIPKITTSHATASSVEVGGSTGSASGSDQQTRRAPVQRKSWFGRRKRSDSAATASSVASGTTLATDVYSDDGTASQHGRKHDDDGYIPVQFRGRQGALEQDWGVGDDLGMELG